MFQLDPKDIDAWHEEVELFKVQDSESKDIMGYFYLDLHPRDGKFGHAAVFPLQPGCIGPDGTMQVSLCAMMANFSKVTFIIHFLNIFMEHIFKKRGHVPSPTPPLNHASKETRCKQTQQCRNDGGKKD